MQGLVRSGLYLVLKNRSVSAARNGPPGRPLRETSGNSWIKQVLHFRKKAPAKRIAGAFRVDDNWFYSMISFCVVIWDALFNDRKYTPLAMWFNGTVSR